MSRNSNGQIVIDLTNDDHFPSILLSFDIGPRNTAFAAVDRGSKRLLAWEREDVQRSSASLRPTEVAARVERLVQRILTSLPRYNSLLVVVEKQPMYTGPQRAMVALMNCMVEAALSTAFAARQVPVIEWDPKQVQREFSLPQSYQHKKRGATLAVQALLQEPEAAVCVSEQQRNAFQGEAKKDDLADCLLQAVSAMRAMPL